MERPKIHESQLTDLLDCLYECFSARHGANTSKLAEHKFYLTDRMSCSKAARLNFMYTVTTNEDQRVQMHNSIYADAVKTLIHRGLAEWRTNEALTFTLTLNGYERAHMQRNVVRLKGWKKLSSTFNEHQGLIAVIAIIVGAIVTTLSVI